MTDLVPVESMPLAAIRERIAALLHPGADEDLVRDLYQEWQHVKRTIRENDAAVEERMLEWLEANGRELVIGDTKLYPGKRTDEKCRDLHAALDAALTLSGGDVEVIEGLLSANALKPGAWQSAFGAESRAEHFEKRVSPTVEVKKLNLRYLKEATK